MMASLASHAKRSGGAVASAPKFKSLITAVSIDTWRGLEAIAAEAGTTVEELADQLLAAIVEDDQAAHQMEAAE
jgi:hypothetical protein